MHSSRANYRELYDSILAEERQSIYWLTIAPWVESHPEAREWLLEFASRRGNPIPPADIDDLHHLYALSRINEIFLLGFQRGRADGTDWPGPGISLDEYERFALSLGLTITDVGAFSPFFHELVEVEESFDEDQPVQVLSTFWPCLMLGDMLFSRAGVRVLAGKRFLRKEVAESSTLYWAYRRKNRPYQDLSHGWGSNSQWGTCFRRDYRIDGELYYNVDRTNDLALSEKKKDRDGLTREERIELLTHRCFVRTTKPHVDQWPYDDKLRVKG